MDIASDFLLKSGPTWIDELAPTLDSLEVAAHVQLAGDGGELLRILAIGPNVCSEVMIAIRPWGVFVNLCFESDGDRQARGRGVWRFMKSNVAGNAPEVLDALARCLTGPHFVSRLQETWDLCEYGFREFQLSGWSLSSSLLRADGWRRLTEDEEIALQRKLGLGFWNGTVALNDAFPSAVRAAQMIKIDTDAIVELFRSNRSTRLDRAVFWKFENDIRRVFCEALEAYGQECSHFVVFKINHGTYTIERPAGGWLAVATIAWPEHLLNCGDHVLVLAPEIHEGFSLNEVRRYMIACGPLLSARIAKWRAKWY